jgi:hypothetical protein
MRIGHGLVVCTLAATAGWGSALWAQQGYVVAGRVVDQVTGVPLARAVAELEPVVEAGAGQDNAGAAAGGEGARGQRFGGQRFGGRSPGGDSDRAGAPAVTGSVTTGADGSFKFVAVPEGKYRLAGSRRGYLTANLDQHGQFFAAVYVGAGHPEAGAIRLALPPEAEIHGMVRDSSGDPVESASVTLFRKALNGTGRVLPVRTATLEPGSSSYEIVGLAPDTYYVGVSGRPWWAQTGVGGADGMVVPSALDVAYALTFFDGATSSDQAEPIVLKAGDAAEADVTLGAVPAVHVQVGLPGGRGFVQMQTPAFGGSIPAAQGFGSIMRQTRDQTTMEMSLAPGTYRMDGETDISITENTTLPAAAELVPVAVTGKVGMADGSALPTGTRVELVPEDAGGAADWFGRGRRRFGGFGQRQVPLILAADGTVHADKVLPGIYAVQATLPTGQAAVVGVAASGATVSGETVTVGAAPVMLAATLARADGLVMGRVVHGEAAAAGVMVVLVPEDGAAKNLYQQDETDLDGSFVLRNVAAGRYRVVAIEDGWDLAWKDAGVLARYLEKGQVVIAAGSGVTQTGEPVVEQNR